MTDIKFTTIIASCLAKHARFEYLKKTINGVKSFFGDACDEIIVLFDKIGIDKMMDVDICVTHNNGLGYSFNEGIRLAKNEMVLQLEDDWIPNQLLKETEKGIHNIAYDILKKKKGVLRLYCDPLHNKIVGSHLGAKICIDPHYHLEIIKADKNVMYDRFKYGYYYSNAPQFKLKSFVTDIGLYPESASPPIVETTIGKKFLASDEYKIFFIVSIFTIIGNGSDSIRDIHLNKNLNQNRKNNSNDNIKDNISRKIAKYNYEYVYGFGNHHLPGKLIEFASKKCPCILPHIQMVF